MKATWKILSAILLVVLTVGNGCKKETHENSDNNNGNECEMCNPSITVLKGESFVHEGDAVDLDTVVLYGFYMNSNIETGKELKTLVISITNCDREEKIIDLTGLTEYTFTNQISFTITAKDIIGEVNITATVTDIGGNSASTSINFFINDNAKPLIGHDFIWVKQGSNVLSAEEMEAYGLRWGATYKDVYVTIERLPGAILYVCNGDDFIYIETDRDMVNYFANLRNTTQPVDYYRNISATLNDDYYDPWDDCYKREYNDMLAVIDPGGDLHVIHIQRSRISNFGYQFNIFGCAKNNEDTVKLN